MWTDDIKDWSGRGMVECIRVATEMYGRGGYRGQSSPDDHRTAAGVM